MGGNPKLFRRHILPFLSGANPRQAVSRPINILSSKSLPCLRIEQFGEGGGLAGVEESRRDLMGLGRGGEDYTTLTPPNAHLRGNSAGGFDETFEPVFSSLRHTFNSRPELFGYLEVIIGCSLLDSYMYPPLSSSSEVDLNLKISYRYIYDHIDSYFFF